MTGFAMIHNLRVTSNQAFSGNSASLERQGIREFSAQVMESEHVAVFLKNEYGMYACSHMRNLTNQTNLCSEIRIVFIAAFVP